MSDNNIIIDYDKIESQVYREDDYDWQDPYMNGEDILPVGFIPTISGWISALGMAYIGKDCDLDELLNVLNGEQAGRLTSDISYFHSKGLYEMCKAPTTEQINMIARRIQGGDTSLRDFHTCSGEVVYYPIARSNTIVNGSAEYSSEGLSIQDGQIKFDLEELTSRVYEAQYNANVSYFKESTTEVLPKIRNAAVAQASVAGIFSNMKYLEGNVENEWNLLVKEAASVNDKGKYFTNQFTSSTSVPYPDISSVKRMATGLDYDQWSKDQKIRGIGNVSVENMVNELQKLRLNMVTAAGREKHTSMCHNAIVDRLFATHGEELVILLPNPDTFRLDINCKKLKDVSELYDINSKVLKQTPECVLMLSTHQMSQADRIHMIMRLLRAKTVVHWMTNYSHLTPVEGGLVCSSFYQFNPYYDLTHIEFRIGLSSRTLGKYTSRFIYEEGVPGDINNYNIQKDGEQPFCLIMDKQNMRVFRQMFVYNYYQHIVEFLKHVEGMFLKGKRYFQHRDNLVMAGVEFHPMMTAVGEDDSEIRFDFTLDEDDEEVIKMVESYMGD